MRRSIRSRLALIGLCIFVFTKNLQASPEQSLRLELAETWGPWKAWGTSLAWWAHAMGQSSWATTYAKLFFGRGSHSLLHQTLPGVGLTAVRYNIGGGGQPGDIPELMERVPQELPWHRDIDGFRLNWSESPESYNWTRDPGQRRMLKLAVAEGVQQVELFANAPMWWMMDSQSSAGGRLQAWNRRDFARYLACVTEKALKSWQIPITSLEPFNEPSATWWNYPKNQEGAHMSRDEQAEILDFLSQELKRLELPVKLAAADENTMISAQESYQALKKRYGSDGRRLSDHIEQVNVHSYNGLDAWRDNEARQHLRETIGAKPLWVTEFGDPETSGLELAQTILEDVRYLRAEAWTYWQLVEPPESGAWGLINAHFGEGPFDPELGTPLKVSPKYYAFAHFTRFIRPGMVFLRQPDPDCLIAWSESLHSLQLVCLNRSEANSKEIDLSLLPGAAVKVPYLLVRSQLKKGKLWQIEQGHTESRRWQLQLARDELVSLSFDLTGESQLRDAFQL